MFVKLKYFNNFTIVTNKIYTKTNEIGTVQVLKIGLRTWPIVFGNQKESYVEFKERL